ncbi:sigma factor-like helix-turn-helix DNA-binding protein [Modestobacter italicus]|uniref:sigma factor-like helix-turn-helix DNA-binding protein n=1 Tax=Modestobacter italicus (strain DSM 44449 / CECT 9708 / BC 501) TaxID=2732864 RepID=UPI001C93AD7D|nr:sigma factor-like helix-turn-helix DNA-binding protein [Modestobacter italicus]
MSAGDDAAFQAFVAAQATGLLRTAHLLTGDPAQAHDLLLTALDAARRQWAGPEQAARVARRALLTEQLSWRRRLELGEALADSPLLSGTAGLPGLAAAAPARRSPTAATLARLPPLTRAVLVLRYGEGLSAEEAATELARPVQDVAVAAERGLARYAEQTDGGDVEARLRRDLAVQAAEVAGVPADLADQVRARARGRRRHRAGLLAALAFVLTVLVVVASTV